MKKLLYILLLVSLSAKGQTAEEFYNKGVEKSNSKDYEGSLAAYDSAIAINPVYTDAYYNRATSKLYLKDYKGAIADFDKTLNIKPDLLKAYSNRGIAKLKINDTRGALKDFDAAVKIDPDDATAHFMLGQVKLQDGDIKGGCFDLSKANDLGDGRAQKFLQQYCANVSYANAENKQNESLKLDWDAEGWKIVSNQSDEDIKTIELLKNNENFQNWTEMGTMMIYRSMHGVPLDDAMNIMYEQAKKICAGARLTFIEKKENTKYPWIIFKIECDAGDASESQVWQILDGEDAMYIYFRAIKEKTIPDDLRDKWVEFFKTARIVTK